MTQKLPQGIQYLCYLRKSTDDDEKQVLSLDAQIFETARTAEQNNLPIHESFTDCRTATKPGRPEFGRMMKMIECGLPFPVGILCWDPDRLSRNRADSDWINRLIEEGKIADLRFPRFAYENTPSGHFMLNVHFALAKLYTDKMSEHIKKCVAEKLRRGEWPGGKYFGYVYDEEKKNIMPHPKEAAMARQIYEEFSTGTLTLQAASKRLAAMGATNRKGKPFSISVIRRLLSNELYIGVMNWMGETYEGRYETFISKRLFDEVQRVLENRSRPHKRKARHDFPFCGLFRCTCGAMITAQWCKGRGGLYRYYRCTRKRGPCSEPYTLESRLRTELEGTIREIALSPEDLASLRQNFEEMLIEHASNLGAHTSTLRKEEREADSILDQLLERRLQGELDEETYQRNRGRFLARKIAVKDELKALMRSRTTEWNEPMRAFIKALEFAAKMSDATSHDEIARFLTKIGTNHQISGKKAYLKLREPYDFVAQTLAQTRGAGGEGRSHDSAGKAECVDWGSILQHARTVFSRRD